VDYYSSCGSNHNHSCIAEGAFRSDSNRPCSIRRACDTSYNRVRPNSSDIAIRGLHLHLLYMSLQLIKCFGVSRLSLAYQLYDDPSYSWQLQNWTPPILLLLYNQIQYMKQWIGIGFSISFWSSC
jgi:hypothetical protein